MKEIIEALSKVPDAMDTYQNLSEVSVTSTKTDVVAIIVLSRVLVLTMMSNFVVSCQKRIFVLFLNLILNQKMIFVYVGSKGNVIKLASTMIILIYN